MEKIKIVLSDSDVALIESNLPRIKEKFDGFKIIHKKMIPIDKDGLTESDGSRLFNLEIRVESLNHLWAIAKLMGKIENFKSAVL